MNFVEEIEEFFSNHLVLSRNSLFKIAKKCGVNDFTEYIEYFRQLDKFNFLNCPVCLIDIGRYEDYEEGAEVWCGQTFPEHKIIVSPENQTTIFVKKVKPEVEEVLEPIEVQSDVMRDIGLIWLGITGIIALGMLVMFKIGAF